MTEGATLRSVATARAKRLAGRSMTVKVRCLLRGYGLPRWGNLRRTTPFSSSYGFERGTPIDRYYLNAFLAMHRDRIAGDVLEVQTSSYTERFGRGVARADTFDIEPRFAPTHLCDFAHCGDVIPGAAYDCLLLPNTLPHFRELDLAGLGFTTGFTTRSGFARPAEPALERSRFVVLASVTAAELAHRIAYAWPC